MISHYNRVQGSRDVGVQGGHLLQEDLHQAVPHNVPPPRCSLHCYWVSQVLLVSDWLTWYNTYFWLVDMIQYLLLIGSYKSVLISDWLFAVSGIIKAWGRMIMARLGQCLISTVFTPGLVSEPWDSLLFRWDSSTYRQDMFVLLLTIIISSCIKQQT